MAIGKNKDDAPVEALELKYNPTIKINKDEIIINKEFTLLKKFSIFFTYFMSVIFLKKNKTLSKKL